MKNNVFKSILIFGLLLLTLVSCKKQIDLGSPETKPETNKLKASSTKVSAIYGGGPTYINASSNISELKASGFTTVVVWTIHIDASGNLNFNAEFPVASNGSYVGANLHPDFVSNMALLKQAPTSVNRIEFGLSAWASPTFANIKSLIASQGTGPTSILYKNFQALKQAVPSVDAINFDDESTYDVASSVQFAVMLADLGYKVTLCPYTSSSYWTSVASQTNSQRPGTVDAIFLQCYDGGAGNSPCSWNFGGIPIYPGLWGGSSHMSPSQIQSSLTSWKNSCGITGAFIWLYDDIKGSAAQYATAVNNAVGVTTSVPGAATNPNPANGATGVSTAATISWTAGSGTTSHNVYFGTTSTPASKGSQSTTTYNPGTLTANTTYYWRIDEVNSAGTTTGALWSFTTGSAATSAQVNLSSSFNLSNGITNDATTFPSTGGLDGVGYAYSKNLLGTSVNWSGASFTIGAANTSDVVACSGQSITLPSGKYSSIKVLASATNGSQTSQSFVVTYSDNTTTTFTQSISDWCGSQNYSGESKAVTMTYRNISTGAKQTIGCYVYGYSFALNNTKTVSSIKLPNNSKVKVLAMTLVP